ncbi:3-hydroxyacyl-CoA dehydrogenase NAD-binding domain-containing protein [Phocaeicola massiliensis]|uniref:3-hydroxyacyl-CoA dehydrogenase NAD-binding domain-containing protein n=1 Tax=Phocaeicola massiliensis TaxID=204516 RepID=UPI003308B390|nr:3-hydroxyacyl-CoA dehydrogenase NAD-binding domain-containing protein [Bacteroidaceae bacterium UO.H1004]
MDKNIKIAVAGTGYVGLSIATLLAQHHQVTAVDVIPEKVELINRRKSPIQDEYIEKYLTEKELNLTATLDGAKAYADADFVVSVLEVTKYLFEFIKIIGIKLKTGRSSVIKKLHEGHSILSASTMEPSEQNIWKWMDNEQDEGENS